MFGCNTHWGRYFKVVWNSWLLSVFLGLAAGGNLYASQWVPAHVSSQLSQLDEKEYAWIGARIYQNEAASNPKYLTYWGEGEAFPSFGIAHFIWFPDIPPPPYQETFPAMFEFVSKKIPPPVWLQQYWAFALQSPERAFDAPWSDKSQFDAAYASPELKSLRQWLADTKSYQAKFVVVSFQQRWLQEIASLPNIQQKRLTQRLNQMMSFKRGVFAVLDYFNFKGLGNHPREQYQGEPWGLMSVLETMPASVFEPDVTESVRLQAFIQAAKERLQRRVELAPEVRNEARWIPGWFKRLEGYVVP